MRDEVFEAAQTIWNYMTVGDEVGPADSMIVLGSRDDRVASYAAGLAQRCTFGCIVLTGGIAHRTDLLATAWNVASEADHFAAVMRREGYEGGLLLERTASNTGENARFTHGLLAAKGIKPKSLLIVTKPYMERRALATFEAQWPDAEASFTVTSSQLSLSDYINEGQPLDVVLNVMAGDLQRILDYPAQGYQSKQNVPEKVLAAQKVLIQAGYDQHMPNQKS